MFMKRSLLPLVLVAAALAAQSTAALAQTDVTVPGGASGANVFCLQAGDLNSGAFVGTFMQTGTGAWEERLKAGTFKLEEMKRDELSVELFDGSRSASLQFDFVNKMIKFKSSSSTENWRDRYHILNATDKAGSADCVALASISGSGQAGGGPGGGGGGAGGAGGAGSSPAQLVGVPPKTVLVIPPGTQLTATSGPPCPGNPGFFLCPNKFSCAQIGGVCCPGAGSCNAGTFCDRFIGGNCIVPGNPRFCAGTGNVRTGTSLHCAPGKTCIAGNLCS
jgi:hypothetical protein